LAIPNRLAIRGGGWFETAGQDDEYLTLDFNLAQKIGLALGATVRLGPVDVSAAFQHTFFATLDNGGRGAIPALSGNAGEGFRSTVAVNGGSLAESMNEVALGATLRW
jgi:long-chain fatty acid transport protein